MGKSKIKNTKSTLIAKSIKDLISLTFTQPNDINIQYDLGSVNSLVKSKLSKTYDQDLSEYKHIIDSSAIRHTIKNHGDAVKEAKKGQLPITLDQFEKIKSIISNPDKVYFDGKNKIGRDILVYEKQMDNLLIYIEEVRTGKKVLALNSMRIKKLKTTS